MGRGKTGAQSTLTFLMALLLSHFSFLPHFNSFEVGVPQALQLLAAFLLSKETNIHCDIQTELLNANGLC